MGAKQWGVMLALTLMLQSPPAQAGVLGCLINWGRAAKAFFWDGDIWAATAALKDGSALPFQKRGSAKDPLIPAGFEKGLDSDPSDFFQAQLAGQNPDLLRLAERLLALAKERGVKVKWAKIDSDGAFDYQKQTLLLDYKSTLDHPAQALLTLYHEMIHVLNVTSQDNPIRLKLAGVQTTGDFIRANEDSLAYDEARAQALELALHDAWIKKRLVNSSDVPSPHPEWQRKFRAILEKHGQSGKLNVSEPALREIAQELKRSNYLTTFELVGAYRFHQLEALAAREKLPLASYDGMSLAEFANRLRAHRLIDSGP